MRITLAAVLATLIVVASVPAAPPDDTYRLGPDSEPHEGVPQGKIIGPTALASNVYPNTTRNYWVYVPAQYDPSKPASLMIFFDGHAYVGLKGQYRIPYVFDNLIYRREMPVTIGVFINPGHTATQKEASDSDWGDGTTNRRVEYNALDDKYSKLVVDELLPVLKKNYNVSDAPEHRAISGASSGAICAFTVAWHRPDQFRKVISTIGSFTNIMGGHVYPDLIRQSEPKPIRIFLQDGVNDNRGVRRGGQYDPKWDWHAQNIKMVQALTEKKYDVNFTWGIGTHSNKQGGAIMPEMLRWLWRDYPRRDDPKDASDRKLLVPAGSRQSSMAPEPLRPRVVRTMDDGRVYYQGVALNGATFRFSEDRKRIECESEIVDFAYDRNAEGSVTEFSVAVRAVPQVWLPSPPQSQAAALPGSRSTSYADLDGDSELDFRIKRGPGLQETAILYEDGWITVGNSKGKTGAGTIVRALDGRSFRFGSGKWQLSTK
jgi:enterochelin esterase-like enzyme